MIYLKTYEFFSFKKTKTWKDKFNDIYSNFLKNKDKRDISIINIPDVDIKDNSFYISLRGSQIAFYGKGSGNRDMEVVDFDIADYSDPKSTTGVYKITQSEYDEFESKCQTVSDWLDDLSEENKGKSYSNVGDNGEISLDFDEGEIELEALTDQVKNKMPIGESLEFEMAYHAWTSNSKNTFVVERKDLKIEDFNLDFGGGRFYAKVSTKDPFDQDAEMWIESDTCFEYYDLENSRGVLKHDKKIIRMSTKDPEMSRKEKREFDKNRKFPYSFSYEITPSKYNSIEFIKSIVELLSELNRMLKEKLK